jgi:hypothetical protein
VTSPSGLLSPITSSARTPRRPAVAAAGAAYGNGRHSSVQRPDRTISDQCGPRRTRIADRIAGPDRIYWYAFRGTQWYCPATPGPLIDATADHRAAAIATDLYAARIASRAPYRLKRKDGPDPDGYQRMSCPAAAPGSSAPSTKHP